MIQPIAAAETYFFSTKVDSTMKQKLQQIPEDTKRVGALLDGDYPMMLNVVLENQHRSFTDWLKRTIELDYRLVKRGN